MWFYHGGSARTIAYPANSLETTARSRVSQDRVSRDLVYDIAQGTAEL
jgi:hypothetical protein